MQSLFYFLFFGEMLAQSLVRPLLVSSEGLSVSETRKGCRSHFMRMCSIREETEEEEEKEKKEKSEDFNRFGLHSPEVREQLTVLLKNISSLLKNWEVVDWLGNSNCGNNAKQSQNMKLLSALPRRGLAK